MAVACMLETEARTAREREGSRSGDAHSLGSRGGAYPSRTEVSTDRTHEQDYAGVLGSERGQ